MTDAIRNALALFAARGFDVRIFDTAAQLRAAVLDGITQQMNTNMGGTSGYKKFLKAMGLSKKQFQEMMYNQTKRDKLADYLYNAETGVEQPTEDECYELFCENYCSAMHILISTQKAEGQADYDAALARAQEALARAEAGEDFSKLIDEYGEDPGQDSAVGYVFPEGYMVAAFSDAAFALEPGEISGIVQSSYGYHIIKRNPITREVYAQYHSAFYEQVKKYKFQELIAAEVEQMNITVPEDGASLDMTDALMYVMGY